ncbi:hypothetical protein G6045_11710 [Streptomyces sp. YC504]|uniref:Uncharacterized protein n=1 Tax=Streptomyces mesophilus TaxID=1775132 RepID=A0A6G4XI55_9ACTN|nr:hypothetical protein [Streptomyces mesophilus]NGO76321.1 hypothetical protein [Streptomyces mesophilus]
MMLTRASCPVRFINCECTLNDTRLIVHGRKGKAQQLKGTDISSVTPRMGMFAPKVVRIGIGATVALQIFCSSRDEVREVGRLVDEAMMA